MERRVFSRVSAISASCASFLHTFFWQDRNGTKQQTSVAFAVWRGRAAQWTRPAACGGTRDMKLARTNARGATVAVSPQKWHSGEYERQLRAFGAACALRARKAASPLRGDKSRVLRARQPLCLRHRYGVTPPGRQKSPPFGGLFPPCCGFYFAFSSRRSSFVLKNISMTGMNRKQISAAVKPPLYSRKPPCVSGTLVTSA